MENFEPEMAELGKRMIEAAVNLDEALFGLLKVEIRRLNNAFKKKDGTEEEQRRIMHLIRNLIVAIQLTNEKIETGLDLCFMNRSKSEQGRNHL